MRFGSIVFISHGGYRIQGFTKLAAINSKYLGENTIQLFS